MCRGGALNSKIWASCRSPISGTCWAVRLLFYVIRPLPQCYPTFLPPLFWQQVYKFYEIILALRNHHSHYKKTKQNKKNGIVYIYTNYLARTQKIEEVCWTGSPTTAGPGNKKWPHVNKSKRWSFQFNCSIKPNFSFVKWKMHLLTAWSE